MQSVVHFVSGDETEQETSLEITRNLLNDETGVIDDVAVVAQAGGINTIRADGDHADQVQSPLDDGVLFKACRNTLEMKDMDESALIEGIETVPEGAVEVTRLEYEGFAYMRP